MLTITNLSGFGGKYTVPITLTYQSQTADSSGSAFTMPTAGAIEAGDLLIMISAATQDASTDAAIADPTLTGWTAIDDTYAETFYTLSPPDHYVKVRTKLWYLIADGTEDDGGTISSVLNSAEEQHVLLVFRPDRAISSVSVYASDENVYEGGGVEGAAGNATVDGSGASGTVLTLCIAASDNPACAIVTGGVSADATYDGGELAVIAIIDARGEGESIEFSFSGNYNAYVGSAYALNIT